MMMDRFLGFGSQMFISFDGKIATMYEGIEEMQTDGQWWWKVFCIFNDQAVEFYIS